MAGQRKVLKVLLGCGWVRPWGELGLHLLRVAAPSVAAYLQGWMVAAVAALCKRIWTLVAEARLFELA